MCVKHSALVIRLKRGVLCAGPYYHIRGCSVCVECLGIALKCVTPWIAALHQRTLKCMVGIFVRCSLQCWSDSLKRAVFASTEARFSCYYGCVVFKHFLQWLCFFHNQIFLTHSTFCTRLKTYLRGIQKEIIVSFQGQFLLLQIIWYIVWSKYFFGNGFLNSFFREQWWWFSFRWTPLCVSVFDSSVIHSCDLFFQWFCTAGVTLKIITLWCLRCVLVHWQVITPATRRGNRSLLCIFRFVVVSCSHFTVLHAREVLCRLNDRPCPLMLPYFLGLMISIF